MATQENISEARRIYNEATEKARLIRRDTIARANLVYRLETDKAARAYSARVQMEYNATHQP